MSTRKKMTFLSMSFVMATLAMLCQNVSTQMLNTTLSPFANYLWQSKTMGGLLTSFFNIGSIVMAFLSAPMIEKIGKKLTIIIFSLVFCASTMLFVFIPEENVTLFARVLQGIGKGCISVACSSVVADVTPKEQMNEGMGIFGLGATFAMAFGPMIALNAVGENNNYDLMFIMCAAIVAAGALFACLIKKDTAPKKEKTEEKSQYKGVARLIEFRALLPSFNYTVFFASFACVLVFSTVYAQEILLLTANEISMFYMVAAVVMLVVRLFGGRLADKHGELTMIIPGHIAIMLLLVILAFMKAGSSAAILFWVCGGLYGLGNAAVQPSLNAIAVVDSPEDRSAVANATFFFMMDFGILFSSSVFGKVIDAAATPLAGYRTTFLCSVGICLLSLFLSVVFLNRKARAKRKVK